MDIFPLRVGSSTVSQWKVAGTINSEPSLYRSLWIFVTKKIYIFPPKLQEEIYRKLA
ncbi:MAG: hypothetical protein WCG98_01795 [bacterium]